MRMDCSGKKNKKKLEKIPRMLDEEDTCYVYASFRENFLGYGSSKFYAKMGWEIVEFSEFVEVSKANKDILKKICESIRYLDYIENDAISIDDDLYYINEKEELSVSDVGKYQCGGTIYQVINKHTGEEIGLIKQDWTRSGSYFSDYYYSYETPYPVKKIKKVIEVEQYEAI